MRPNLRIFDDGQEPAAPADLRLFTPWDPKGPHYKLAVVSRRVVDLGNMTVGRLRRLEQCGLAGEVQRYPTCFTAITDCDTLSRDRDRLGKLHAVGDAGWVVVWQSLPGDRLSEIRRQPLLRLVVAPKKATGFWWRMIFGWGKR